MSRFDAVTPAAQDRWPEILNGLGIGMDYLTKKHGPCPGCGGSDRFRFDDKGGNGTFICGGGGDTLAGDGFALLQHVYGWSSAEALHQVAAYLQMDDGQPSSKAEREEGQRQAKQRRRKAETEERKQREEAAQRASAILSAAKGDPATHPYAVKKGIHFGSQVKRGEWLQRKWKDALLIPIVDEDGETWTLEAISEKGEKDFLKGGRKRGGFHPLGKIHGADCVLIGEGLATVAAAHSVMECPAVAAMDSSNLPSVAQVIRKLAPRASIILLADNDMKPGKPNGGLISATKAAQEVGGKVVVPDIGGRKCDFWDLWSEKGPDAVRSAIEKAVTGEEEAERKPLISPVPDEDERPCHRVLNNWHGKLRPGVWYFGIKEGRGEAPPTPFDIWICSPLHVEAITNDERGVNFGRLLRLRDTVGRWKEWSMPMAMLAGSGEELRRELLSLGLEIDPTNRKYLDTYLQGQHPGRQVMAASKTGWSGDSYVLPNGCIGNDDVTFQAENITDAAAMYHQRGTVADWKDSVGRYAQANPLLMLCLSIAFAAPLLKKVHRMGGGFHLVGSSSTGKSTAAFSAASVWGEPVEGKQVRFWLATSNGLEGTATAFNDNLLTLDEIGQVDPHHLGATIYMLANGSGKQRANRHGATREAKTWRLLFLSTGEIDKKTKMAEAGSTPMAGQEVRLIELAVNRKHGAFDELYQFEDGRAFADALKDGMTASYGTVGSDYLAQLVQDQRDYGAMLADTLKQFPAIPGQEGRVAERFAIAAMGGELATEYDLTGWRHGEATAAAVTLFSDWLSDKPRGNQEAYQIIEPVQAFLDRHGGARFESRNGSATNLGVRERAGWVMTLLDPECTCSRLMVCERHLRAWTLGEARRF